MPSKDILSIDQFQINQQQQPNVLYPRAYALPQFFSTNLVDDQRVVKLFSGQNAVIRAFYFNYMKLAIQSDQSSQYFQLLKELFVTFDYIQEGQLQDKFLSDFQYRKFFKDFIQKAIQKYTPDFQQTAKKFPIIDQILQKLFKSIVPISLYLPEDNSIKATDFEIVKQIITFLCQQFQEEYSIELEQRCIKFEASQMFLYVQSLSQIYIAYIDKYIEQNQKVHNFRDSSGSSFVCGQGNSFTSKFKSNNSSKVGTKHPFKKIHMLNAQENQQHTQRRKPQTIETQYYSQNGERENVDSNILYVSENQKKMSLLLTNGSLIKRRSKNDYCVNQQRFQKLLEQSPISCYQYQKQQVSMENSNQTPIQFSARESQKAETLINILDSRVSQFDDGNEMDFTSRLLQKAPQKGLMIMRRKSNKMISQNGFEQIMQDKKSSGSQQFINNEKKFFKNQNIDFQNKSFDFDQPINLPEPFYQQVTQKAQQSSVPFLNTKNNLYQMQQILEMGSDEDQQNTINQFFQDENNSHYQSKFHDQKIVNLTDNLSYKLTIERIQSRDVDLSKASIGNNLNSPTKLQKLSFFDADNQQKENSKISIKQQSNPYQKKSFQQFMKQMKDRYPFQEKHTNHVSDIKSQQVKNQHYSKSENKPFSQIIQNKFNLGDLSLQSNMKNISAINQFMYSDIKSSNRCKNVKFNQNIVSEKERKYPKDKSFATEKQNFQQKLSFVQQRYRSERQNIHERSLAQMPSDEFTRSDILLLLDQQYRDKIRAIKNEYKSVIRQDHHSKSDFQSGKIDYHHNIQNQGQWSGIEVNNYMSEIVSKKLIYDNNENKQELKKNNKKQQLMSRKGQQIQRAVYQQIQRNVSKLSGKQMRGEGDVKRSRETSIYLVEQ